MNIDRRRATSFGTHARLYNDSRPSYPVSSVTWILEVVAPTGTPLDVVDLGAGTGKLSKVLSELGHNVWAVEPDPDMLALVPLNAPSALTLNGKDTRIPLGDASVDAVLVGQAWHWFDHEKAEQEIARVLKPGGVLGILWNTYDWGVDWVREYDALLHKGDPRDASHSLPTVSWAPTEEFTTSWTWERTPEQLVELAGSVSWIMSLETAEKAKLLQAIHELTQAQVGLGETASLAYSTQAYRLVRP